MKLRTFTFLAVLAASVTTNPLMDQSLSILPSDNSKIMLTIQYGSVKVSSITKQQQADQLFDSVVLGDYEAAVTTSLSLESVGRGEVILDTVTKLLKEGKRNVLEYAYKLWNTFGKAIVKDYFPIEFRIIFNGDYVMIVNKKYEFPIAIDSVLYDKNNSIVFGRGAEERAKFIFKSIWEENSVYFKIIDTKNNRYLKLLDTLYNEGLAAYVGPERNTCIQQWFLQPVIYNGDLLFNITNREYNRILFMSNEISKTNARSIYGQETQMCSVLNSEHFAWYIKPF